MLEREPFVLFLVRQQSKHFIQGSTCVLLNYSGTWLNNIDGHAEVSVSAGFQKKTSRTQLSSSFRASSTPQLSSFLYTLKLFLAAGT